VTITLTRAATTAQESGRHRLGRPGLVAVTSLIAVVHRGWLSHWLRPGRHHYRITRARRRSAAVPVAATG